MCRQEEEESPYRGNRMSKSCRHENPVHYWSGGNCNIIEYDWSISWKESQACHKMKIEDRKEDKQG